MVARGATPREHTVAIDKTGGTMMISSVDAPTQQEQAILLLMAQGYSNQQIAKAMFLSANTVKNYISVIIQKYGVRNRTEAVIRAMVCGDVATQFVGTARVA